MSSRWIVTAGVALAKPDSTLELRLGDADTRRVSYRVVTHNVLATVRLWLMTAWELLDETTQDFGWSVLDEAVVSLDGRQPFTPYAIVGTLNEKRVHRFAAETLEEGLASGRAWLAQLPAEVEIAALLYDGYLTLSGERTDAVYLEVHQRGRAASGCLAQRYRPGSPPDIIGNPGDCGDRPPLLGGGPPKKRGLFGRR